LGIAIDPSSFSLHRRDSSSGALDRKKQGTRGVSQPLNKIVVKSVGSLRSLLHSRTQPPYYGSVVQVEVSRIHLLSGGEKKVSPAETTVRLQEEVCDRLDQVLYFYLCVGSTDRWQSFKLSEGE
jgi:hypothetical protein